MSDIYCPVKVYRRSNGSIGIRNHLAVISTVACANVVAEKISQEVEKSVACTHPYGCDQLGADAQLTFRTLSNIGKHPNVGAVLVVGLGCEEIKAQELAMEIEKSGKPIEAVVIQDSGGSLQSIKKGVSMCRILLDEINKCHLTHADRNELVIGIECGGSDYTSGIASNPAVGVATDMLTNIGAKVIFGETTELLGAEHILISRSSNPAVKKFILDRINLVEHEAMKMKVDIRGAQPSPGNIDGGISSIEEKSLGAICKTGNSMINGAVDYGIMPTVPGLTFMDTPGNDLICTCGLVAGGAHLILFTTGRGTPMGFPIAPVVKITANKGTAEKMSNNIDIDISSILDGVMSIEQAGQMVYQSIFDTANGQLVKAELLGHREFGIHRIGPTL
ncbi:MAG: UxaA family hydrolase [Bacillota bacterium]|nr:UxaA family hydrolase [Bacillota bacterium]